MRRHAWGFALLGLGAALLLATVFSPFASSAPDGLERVAEDQGFLDRAEQGETSAPLPDYAVPGVRSEAAATGLAGLIGTAAVFLLGTGLGLALRPRRGRERTP